MLDPSITALQSVEGEYSMSVILGRKLKRLVSSGALASPMKGSPGVCFFTPKEMVKRPDQMYYLTNGTVSPERVCSYQDVLDHLNLTRGNDVFTSTRPVLDHTHPTMVHLDVYLYAILAVIEKSQTFVPFIWIQLTWNNERIWWDPSQFCGISRISVPKEMLWIPDLLIYEMIEKDDGPHSPYLYVSHDGIVLIEDEMKVVSTCKMDVHKFPFDTQRCNITFSSAIHIVTDIQLIPFSNSSRVTQASREVMQTQGEWEFLDMTVSRGKLILDREWDQISYTITMARRPLLHVINFLLPILFFLCLDLASFLISDQRGEKLGFKVTVLLAISVLLLILNDILPSMSNRTPLIATYCIVIFSFMLLSLLETILVTHLMERDSVHQETEEERRRGCCACICDVSGRKAPCEPLPVAEEVICSEQGESRLLLLILGDLRAVERTLALFASGRREGKPGYWTRVARHLNVAFFTIYLISVMLFISFMCKEWLN
ncbi:5-hydroxytryptamine receptor 3A-like isoform X2 [Oncorhynchus keta]|uniref:5-hydroxytryptamine receptor 3A-like isoform X2 n=1 Tax=Oncorhynchus keta TaxID=8018 RepID=UPI00227A4763|nr:5-hydroxytryptamine receptor 3A-like isoform X2 [Oncorhynchus keta]